jgi:hypothetical protein
MTTVRSSGIPWKSAYFQIRRCSQAAASPQTVLGESDAPVNSNHRKRAACCRPCREAAEGIRTLDLLHGKQTVQRRFPRICLQTGGFSTLRHHEGFPAVTGTSREFGYRMGTRAGVRLLAADLRGACTVACLTCGRAPRLSTSTLQLENIFRHFAKASARAGPSARDRPPRLTREFRHQPAPRRPAAAARPRGSGARPASRLASERERLPVRVRVAELHAPGHCSVAEL